MLAKVKKLARNNPMNLTPAYITRQIAESEAARFACKEPAEFAAHQESLIAWIATELALLEPTYDTLHHAAKAHLEAAKAHLNALTAGYRLHWSMRDTLENRAWALQPRKVTQPAFVLPNPFAKGSDSALRWASVNSGSDD